MILDQIFFSRQVKRSVIISNKYGICELPHKLPNELCNTWISELNTKRLYTTTTHLTHISNIITTKNQETGSNTNHDHTHTYGKQETDHNSMTHNTHNKYDYQYKKRTENHNSNTLSTTCTK